MAFDEEGKGKIIDVEDKQIGTYGNYAHLYPEANIMVIRRWCR